jgi:nitrogen fixation NifU-like protein
MLTDEIKGKSLDEISHMGRQTVLDNLGIEISPARMKCAMLSLETLRDATSDRVEWTGPDES